MINDVLETKLGHFIIFSELICNFKKPNFTDRDSSSFY